MNLSRAFQIAARRAPALTSCSTTTASRGFAVSAAQQTQDSNSMGSLLAAAAVAAGATAYANEKADCCGIAGVVGRTGDAR